MLEIVMILYVFWGWYAGWRFLSGRIALLERPGIQYKILKAISSIIVGYIIGGLFLIYLIVKTLLHLGR